MQISRAAGLLIFSCFVAAVVVRLERDRQATRAAEQGPVADGQDVRTTSSLEVTGRVIDSAGAAIANARLYWWKLHIERQRRPDDVRLIEVGRSRVDGTFVLKLDRRAFDWQFGAVSMRGTVPLIAAADGFGIEWIELKPDPGALTFRLPKDQVVRGQVLSTEGQPVGQVAIEVEGLFADSSGRLDRFLKAWKQAGNSAFAETTRDLHSRISDALDVKTDSNGGFEIRGIGEERIARIQVSGPTFAQAAFYVAARNGLELQAAEDERLSAEHSYGRYPPRLFGPRFTIVAEPTKPIQGIVRDAANGEPVAGATVMGSSGLGGSIRRETDREGRFELLGLPKSSAYSLTVVPPDRTAFVTACLSVPDTADLAPVTTEIALAQGVLGGSIQVAAAAPGFGPAWVWRKSELHHDLLLRLVSDEPIKGRLVDPEGRALTGVRVTVNSVHVTKDGDIASLISSLRERQQGIWLGSSKDVSIGPIGGALTPTLYAAVHTDAGGRFNLRGIGRERLVSLIIETPTIETQLLHVLTSPGVSTIHVPENEQHPQFGMKSYYGSEFTHAVEPSRPIVGTVRDASTGQPVADVRVASTRRIGSPSRFIETVTDERGQYRLTGMRKAKDQRIWIIPSLSHSYPAMAASVGLSRDFEPVTVNVDLPRGVRIEGTVLDKSTGKPVPARVMYMAFRTNPHFMRLAEEGLHLLHADFNFAETTADGTFSLIGLPGSGIVAVRATTVAYLGAVGAEQIDGFDRRYRSLNTSPTCWVENYHALAEVVAGENDEQIRRDLVLDPGRTVAGEVVGPTGEELAGAIAFGLTPSGFGFRWQLEPLPSSSFTVMALKRGEKRTLLFLHDREQLAGMAEVDAADETAVAKLLPWGTLKGRLLDAHGQPRKGVELLASGPRAGGYNSVPNLPQERLLTDQEGRFCIAGLVAGLKYCFRLRELVDENERLVSVVDAVEMQPGQTVDLGDVRPTAH